MIDSHIFLTKHMSQVGKQIVKGGNCLSVLTSDCLENWIFWNPTYRTIDQPPNLYEASRKSK